jgi:hypothetical protein
MMRFLKNCLAAKKSRQTVQNGRSSFQPSLEPLEDRFVPSTVTGMGSGVLFVTNPGDGWAAGTLRSEINQANRDASYGISDKIVFSSKLQGATINLNKGPLEIKPLHGNGPGTTIDGGSGVTLSSNGNSNVFQVDAGAELNLHNLTVKNGFASRGGGVLNYGTLNVFDCTFANDHASQGGAIFNTGMLYINNSHFIQNTAGSEGGAVFNFGTMAAFDSSFIGNTSYGWGGAVSDWGTGTLNFDWFSGNSAYHGGGALVIGANTTFIGSNVFNHNKADYGGAVEIAPHGILHDHSFGDTYYQYNAANVHGGAIYVDHGNNSNATIGGHYIQNTSPQNDPQWWA